VMEWKRLPHLSSVVLAVNLSAAQLRDHTVIGVVERYLRETGFPAADLELEITETAAMVSDRSGSVLAALKSLGLRLSIDDFGTGYSSLGRLQRLPVDALKIDRTFVSGIEGRDSGALAQTIILMAHSLGLIVTGEGVETPHQLEFLELHQCDRVQ